MAKTLGIKKDIPKKKIAQDPLELLKRGIWVYFFLLIFEGALRKWFLPFLSTPLLIIRDPIAFGLIYLAIKQNVLKSNLILTTVTIIGVVSIVTAIFLGHGSLPVALFGARIFLIHFPLIFVIGRVFTFEDVIKMGKIILWISIPMSMLITLQFYSPQSAWVNRGVGGDSEGGGFSGALGFFRPPATFSFITGTIAFYSLAACFIFYFLLNSKYINKLVLYGATGALLIAIPLSISRTLLGSVVVIFGFVLIAVSRKSKYFGQILIGFLAMIVVFIILSNTAAFQTATEAFTARFESANEIEGGLQNTLADRYLGGMISSIQNSTEEPFFGYGTGMGTNVGSQLLRGKTSYLISEGEWGRLIGEMGLLMGLLIITFRLKLCIDIGFASYRKLASDNFLPWILVGFLLLNIPQGQWAQPTILGFSVLGGGLAVSSLRTSNKS
ncbi:MAG: hypothetical protein ABJA90_03805 [Ginsengibacter sp.]